MGRMKWAIAQWAELYWWKWYWRKKDKANYYQWKRQYWINFVDRYKLSATIEAAQTILDAGCGPAGIYTIIPNKNVAAIDPLIESYQKALFFSETDFPSVNFQCSQIEEIAETNQFDLIFCLNAINHTRDIESAMKKLFTALRYNGTIVFTVDAHKSAILNFLFRLIPGDILHPQQLQQRDYERLIEETGFKIQEIETVQKGNIFSYVLFKAVKR